MHIFLTLTVGAKLKNGLLRRVLLARCPPELNKCDRASSLSVAIHQRRLPVIDLRDVVTRCLTQAQPWIRVGGGFTFSAAAAIGLVYISERVERVMAYDADELLRVDLTVNPRNKPCFIC